MGVLVFSQIARNEVQSHPDSLTLSLVPFPDIFVDAGKLPLQLDSCLHGND